MGGEQIYLLLWANAGSGVSFKLYGRDCLGELYDDLATMLTHKQLLYCKLFVEDTAGIMRDVQTLAGAYRGA